MSSFTEYLSLVPVLMRLQDEEKWSQVDELLDSMDELWYNMSKEDIDLISFTIKWRLKNEKRNIHL